MGVTIAVTIIGTLASMLVTCLISYAISIKEMRYRNVIAFICNFTSIFSAGLVPWYVVCVNWYNLSNTLWALILPSMFSVWNMFLMRTYFNNISQSLYDAAKIDGAGHWTIFFRIAMPLSKTAILTVGLMYLLSYWNNWWNALMFISDRDLYPLQYYLYSIVSNVNAISSGCIPSGAAATIRLPSETVKMAVTIITIGPIIFVYPFIQRYINATGGEVLCIPYSAPNPEGALRFLAWLWANQDNYMFCLYGEQGKDWELNDEGRLVLLSNIARGDGYFYEWMFRNFNYKVFPETYRVETALDVSKLPAGKYILALSIKDPACGRPSVLFATRQYFRGGWHPLGYVGIGTWVEQPLIPDALFDDQRTDRTITY